MPPDGHELLKLEFTYHCGYVFIIKQPRIPPDPGAPTPSGGKNIGSDSRDKYARKGEGLGTLIS